MAGHHVGPRELQVGLAGHAGLPGHELGDGHRLPDLLPVPVEDGNLSKVQARGLNISLIKITGVSLIEVVLSSRLPEHMHQMAYLLVRR